MNLKQKRWRSEKYLKWIREQPSCVSGSTGCVAHHIRLGNKGGMGLKPADYCCVPLTPEEHGSLHHIGERTYWMELQCDPDQLIVEYMVRYMQHLDFDPVDEIGKILEDLQWKMTQAELDECF